MQPSKLTIVFNPKGGSAKVNTVTEIAQMFRNLRVETNVVHTTAEAGSATHLAKSAALSGADVVIPFGGDGTVRQVAQGLVGTDATLAVFPGGTGNLFARSFYANPTAKQFVAMVMAGNSQPIDMVRLEYKGEDGVEHCEYQLVALGLGKVSDAISDASPFYKRIFGKLVYAFNISIASLKPEALTFRLKTKDAVLEDDAAAVFVLNVTPPMMSALSRGVNASDGLLDVVVLKGTNTWHLIRFGFSMAFGQPEHSSHYHRFRTEEVLIESSGLVKPNIDGDPGEMTRSLKVTNAKGALKVILSH